MSAYIRLYWTPVNDNTIVYYQIYRSDTLQGPYWLLATVNNDKIGENWDSVRAQFFYDDSTGANDLFYKIIGYNVASVIISQTSPFQPTYIQDSTLNNLVRVDEHYGMVDALRYIAPGGAPISQAAIRIYKNEDYQQGNRTTPFAILQTKNDGRWVSPVYLPLGIYVIQFFKPSGYGPDIVTITV